MAVYKRTYKAYRGPLTPAWSRFMVLSRYGFSTLFESRPFTAYVVLCMLPFLVGLVFIYVVHSTAIQSLLNVRFGRTPLINNFWFLAFLSFEAWMGFLLTAWAAPGMISKDFANQSVQLYLSRPLSRAEYLLGKVSVMAGLLSCTTWIPALILFFVQAQLEGHGWGWDNLWLAGSIFIGAMMWIALISLLAMALAVWVRWRIAATALMMAIFFVLPGFGVVVNAILRTRWGSLLNLSYLITNVWWHLFRIPVADGPTDRLTRLGQVPLWAAWGTLLAVCALCVWVLNRKLKAREVVRG
ncbi:MAG TPA: ABC transporter permease subunit [Candidatus Angelobacter sp.]|nr:ABC transporter permease subunit [Candidatus Angelobacter sp.]